MLFHLPDRSAALQRLKRGALDLADAFAGQIHSAPDLFERVLFAVLQTESQDENLSVSLLEFIEDVRDVVAQEPLRRLFRRR